MNLPQVACGAYHSVALVRSLPTKNYNTQGGPERKERGRSPHFFVGERDELSAVDGGHYCPLGVELTEGASAGDVNMDLFLITHFYHPFYLCFVFCFFISAHCCLFLFLCRHRLLRVEGVQGEGCILAGGRQAAVPALVQGHVGSLREAN